MNFTPTSGTFWVTCNKHACKELIKRSKSIEGVVYAFMVEKKTDNDPDVIIKLTGVNEQQIVSARNIISGIKGVVQVTPELGQSLMFK
ncbi:MAG: hypothetical protein WBP64_16855 [Nitrososphaeraceae archaeon]|jgi:hypothetical protein